MLNMLTKDDLKEIKKIIIPLENEFGEVKNTIGTLTQDTKSISNELGLVKININILAKDTKVIKTSVKKVDKTVNVMLDRLDREQMKQRKSIKRIEDHLGVTSGN